MTGMLEKNDLEFVEPYYDQMVVRTQYSAQRIILIYVVYQLFVLPM